ncbi:hypothetical protein FOC4_g10005652 [Fusarium odoratissimum]|uniref:Uncharacterized protein n=2 Tax=Fusarium oxysporum species complex TaxID=171631 RepID=N1RTM6_FUSC4|nr:hypothetical protein FOC4_g10005652 [Fusarium odoratissimum]TXB95883.1 hypothetical protein FocTR4_00016095 [Fusarium oxysporum f. sp. cubense]
MTKTRVGLSVRDFGRCTFCRFPVSANSQFLVIAEGQTSSTKRNCESSNSAFVMVGQDFVIFGSRWTPQCNESATAVVSGSSSELFIGSGQYSVNCTNFEDVKKAWRSRIVSFIVIGTNSKNESQKLHWPWTSLGFGASTERKPNTRAKTVDLSATGGIAIKNEVVIKGRRRFEGKVSSIRVDHDKRG